MRKGFIKIILLIILALIILSFFNVKVTKIASIFQSDVLKENVNYILQIVENALKWAKELL
ncbi:MAG: hypothetical protein AAB890_01280 [Patescibacteria group bacterium]